MQCPGLLSLDFQSPSSIVLIICYSSKLVLLYNYVYSDVRVCAYVRVR